MTSKINWNMLFLIGITISVSYLAFGIIFKIQHWPFANVLLIAGLSVLAAVYLFLAIFYKLPSDYSSRWRNTFRYSAIFVALGSIGIVFKMLGLPFADEFNIFPLLSFFMGMSGYFYDPAKVEDKINRRVHISAMTIGVTFVLDLLGLFFPEIM